MNGLSKVHQLIAPDVKLGRNVRIYAFVNLYGCEIGDETKIGTFVEIQKGAKIGARCKISSHTFICEGVIIESEVFVDLKKRNRELEMEVEILKKATLIFGRGS